MGMVIITDLKILEVEDFRTIHAGIIKAREWIKNFDMSSLQWENAERWKGLETSENCKRLCEEVIKPWFGFLIDRICKTYNYEAQRYLKENVPFPECSAVQC